MTSRPDAEWDDFVLNHPDGHLLQLSPWGELKSSFGWHATRVVVRQQGTIVGGAQVLYRNMPLGLGAIAYVPRGPLTRWDDPDLTAYILNNIHQNAYENDAWVIKLEPSLPDTPEAAATLQQHGFSTSPHTVQPRRTTLLDLTPDEDAILANMKQKTRYNVRLAEKKEVTVRQADPAHAARELAHFNRLMQLTGKRNEFGVHAPKYYSLAFELFQPTDQVALFFAELAGRPLAAVMVFTAGKQAYYLYGASDDSERQRMPAYAAQWAAIRWAKAQACTSYDFYGIPDADEAELEAGFAEREDGLWPVYRFKRGWGGDVVRSIGAWDFPTSPLGYRAYQFLMKYRGGLAG